MMDRGNQNVLRRRRGSKVRSLALGLAGIGLTLTSALQGIARAVAAEAWQHLPDNTALVLLIDTTADTWGQLRQYQLFQLLEDEQGIVPGLPGLPYLPAGIDFATEVSPWVGDTAVVALLPVPPGETATIAAASIMVAPVADGQAFGVFRASFLERQGSAPEITPVLGNDIYFWPAPQLEEGAESALSQPCDPAIAAATPCDGETPATAAMPDSGIEANVVPPKAGGATMLRLSDSLPLPLTVSPLVEGGQDVDKNIDVEVPLPLPTFGPAGLAVAFLPDALVTAEHPAAIEQYLRQRDSTPSLTDRPEFQRTLANRAASRAFLAVYGNALELLNYDASLAALPQVSLPLPLPPIPSLDADSLQTLRSLNFGGTLEGLVYPLEQGIQVRGRYYYDAVPFTFGLTPRLPSADSPLTLLPASTFLALSGRNVRGFWQSLSSILDRASDVTREGLQAVRTGFTLFTGLDLDNDLFGWMDGEVAIAAFPTDGGPLEYVGLGLLVQTSDRAAAETTLAALDNLLPGFGIAATPRTVNQQPVTSWELLSSWTDDDYIPELSVGSHSWVTDDTLVMTSGAVPMARVLAPSPHDPLANFFLFDQATATFPSPNNGYFYLNVGATLALVYQVFDLHNASGFESTKPYLGSVRSLSSTTTQTPNHMEIYGQLGLAPRHD